MDSEEWRDIQGSPGYSVSNLGRVRSPRGLILKAQSNGRYGYLWLQLTRRRTEYVHRLVAAAFIAPIEGMDVDHRDGDTSNNCASNLRVLSHAENMRAQRERTTVCRRGHSLSDAVWYGGRRTCRTCRKMRERARYRKKRGTTDPAEQYVTMTAEMFARLIEMGVIA